MKIWEIVDATPDHIPALAANMRSADRREVWASHRHTPEQALRMSLSSATVAWACLVEGVPAFMWGVSRRGCILSDVGVPWLLGTDAIHKVSREFLKQSRDYVDRMQDGFTRLENFVHAENRLSIRWLKWCGFVLDEEIPELMNGEDFFLFWRDAE